MPPFSPAALRVSLENILPPAASGLPPAASGLPPAASDLPPAASGALCVAYSGGLDSTALLHATASLTGEGSRYRLRVVHINHQLQPDSTRWRDHCAAVSNALGLEFVSLDVDARQDLRRGPEAAARKARYQALHQVLQPGEILLTAHHADDQLETLLLALLRGAGVRGLSAMPVLQPFGPGWLARPLLEFTRAQLEQWVSVQRLSWIEDPSNERIELDRNYLRHRVVPLLRQRWPAAAASAGRSAQHAGEASRLMESLAASDMTLLSVGSCLEVARLQELEPARRRNVLRYWIRGFDTCAPSTRKLAAIEHDMLNARADRVPCVEWEDSAVLRHRGLLYCLPREPVLAADTVLEWQTAQPLDLPLKLGRLRMSPVAQGGFAAARLAPMLEVRFRAGGEALQPSGDPHHRKLKKLLQAAGVLPWWRDRLPLLYCEGRLAAVGDLWIAQEFAARATEPGLAVVWDGRPRIRAERGTHG